MNINTEKNLAFCGVTLFSADEFEKPFKKSINTGPFLMCVKTNLLTAAKLAGE